MSYNSAINLDVTKTASGFHLSGAGSKLSVSGDAQFSNDGSAILDGELLVGSTAENSFVKGYLLPGTGISIESGAGSITVHAPPFPWTLISGDTALEANNGYLTSGVTGRVLLALPMNVSVGSVFKVANQSFSGFRVTQGSGQVIYFGESSTTVGVSGYLESTGSRDAVEIVCAAQNNNFQVVSYVGGLTVV